MHFVPGKNLEIQHNFKRKEEREGVNTSLHFLNHNLQCDLIKFLHNSLFKLKYFYKEKFSTYSFTL